MEDQVLGSECSSGCESGWTLYLEHSFLSPYPPPSPRGNAHFLDKGNTEDDYEEEEEEDLSMLSDASSGPPHFQEYEDHHCHSNGGGGAGFYYPQPVLPIDNTLLSNKGKNQQKNEENRRRKPQDLPSFLDDTASSPFFNFSNNNLALTNNHASMEDMVDFSQGFSTTHFEGKSTFQEHFGFYHSPVSGSQLQQNQWFEEKRIYGDEMRCSQIHHY